MTLDHLLASDETEHSHSTVKELGVDTIATPLDDVLKAIVEPAGDNNAECTAMGTYDGKDNSPSAKPNESLFIIFTITALKDNTAHSTDPRRLHLQTPPT